MAGDRFAALPIGQELAAANPISASGVADGGIVGPIDLLQWGGLLISGIPDVNFWDQQGYVDYQTAFALGAGFVTIARLPLWPGMRLNAQLPRVGRYGQFVVHRYGTPWSLTPTYSVIVRPTLNEILEVSSILSGAAPQWTWATSVSTSLSIPGDLVAAIDWQFDSRTADPTLISAGGEMDPSVPGSVGQTILTGTTLSGHAAIRGTFAEPYPVIKFVLNPISGSPTGKWSALPIMDRAGPPDIMGHLSDAPTAGTLPALLQQLINQKNAISASTFPIGGATNVAANTWTLTGFSVAAGKTLIGAQAACSVSGLTMLSLGTNAVPGTMVALGNPTARAELSVPIGYGYANSTFIWVQSVNAGVVWWTAWVA